MFERERRKICPSCGTRPEEWDPARGGHRFAYVVAEARCVGCELLEMEHEQAREKDDNLKGVRSYLVPNPTLR